MEAFFALLQENVLDRRHWHTREDLRLALISWIERTHLPPPTPARPWQAHAIEFELLHYQLATAA